MSKILRRKKNDQPVNGLLRCLGCGKSKETKEFFYFSRKQKTPSARCKNCFYGNMKEYIMSGKCVDCEKTISMRAKRCSSCHLKFKFSKSIGHRSVYGGYWYVKISPDSPFREMAGRDRYKQNLNRQYWVRENRLIMAQKLGRCLLPTEIVHHHDGDKLNDDPENLKMTNRSSHQKMYKALKLENKHLSNKIELLKDKMTTFENNVRALLIMFITLKREASKV